MEKINSAGVLLVSELYKKEANTRIRCICPHCGREFEMWRSHFYRGDNPCSCQHPHLYQKFPRLLSIYTNMKTRCSNTKAPGYQNYGAKGIQVCDQWQNSFENFVNWALSAGYTGSLTLDRIDCTKGYEPDNCQWVSTVAQANNKTNNVFFVADGERYSMKRLCLILGVNYKTEHTRLCRKGISAVEERLQLAANSCGQFESIRAIPQSEAPFYPNACCI